MPYDLGDELRLFKQILEALCQDHHLPRGKPIEASRVTERLQAKYTPLSRSEIRTLLARSSRSIDSSESTFAQFLYLEPFPSLGQYIIPVMAFKCRLVDDSAEAGIRLMLVVEYQDGRKALGYRFETGHEGGEHDYCHVQHIKVMDDTHGIPTEPWISEKAPAIPVDAGGPVGLLLCMLGSLYGKDYIKKFPPGTVDLPKVKRSIDQMRPFFH